MWLPLVLCAWLADSKSTGVFETRDSYGCEFDGPSGTQQWGCQTFKFNFSSDSGYAPLKPRHFCLDPNFNTGKFMWWTNAPRPAPANEFSMRTGNGNPVNDVGTYVPNGFVSVYIKALQFDNLYKGLLMYARNSSGGKVGDWIIPEEETPLFSLVPLSDARCAHTVMHVNAEDKPYVSKFTFVAPPAGTGRITIKAMIKTGPPNPTDFGDFWRLPDITLEEEEVVKNVRKWALLNSTSGSCAQYCKDTQQEPCTEVGLSSSIDHLEPSPADLLYPCHGAIFHDCTGNPRVEMPGRFCTYHPSTCKTGASCSLVPDGNTPLFCYCGAPPVESSSSSLGPGLGALIALLSMGFWGSKSQINWAVPALLFAAMPLANAHNWIEGTRGRASNLGANQFCSPTFPQINRNSIQMQVGVRQNFVVEWAAAHGDYTYWIVIHDDARANVTMLTRKFMDDWLRGCPGGGFANSTTTGMKYHRFRPNQNLASNSLVNGQSDGTLTYAQAFFPTPIYNGSVWTAHSINGERPNTFFRDNSKIGLNVVTTPGPTVITPFNASLYPKSMLAEYNKSLLLNDRRCSYENSSFPWIETIHRYQHHDVSTAFATALMRIEARKGPGRYQVHYKWASYCDVIDVDVKANTVAAPYGVPINASDLEYDIAHHCWFEKPRVVGQCLEVVTTPQQCQAICSAHSACKAFQMLPLQLDSSQGKSFGLFPERSYIPWGLNDLCDKSQFAKAPKSGSMICFPIYQFQNDLNSARPLWSFTDDPDHQGFYGTCYIKPRAVSFATFTQVDVDAMDKFRFQSKCVPCDNIGQNLTAPRWGPQQNFCTDCKKTPASPKQLPAVPAWKFFASGTFNQSGSAHWLSPAGSPFAFADECAILAKRDPTCSKYVMYSDYRARRFSGKAGVVPTLTNVNRTIPLINTSVAWHYTPLSLTFPYYRSCACFDKVATLDDKEEDVLPVIDPTMRAMACDGVLARECVFQNFTVYELS